MTGKTDKVCITDIHADDYALTVRTSCEMLDLMRDGVFDSISIVPNMTCYDTCVDMLKEAIPELPFLPLMSVHLDLVEGLCLAPDDGSLMKSSWKGLFADSYLPWRRKAACHRIKEELNAQIRRVWSSVEECISIARANGVRCDQKGLRIDSHQHAHMIPVVWHSLCEVIEENGYDVEYIRNSKESIMPFVSKISLWGSYRIVNFVKNRLLYMYSGKVDRYYKDSGRPPMYMWGLVMSGRMDKSRIAKLYPTLCDRASRDGRRLEILFHPGRMADGETSAEIPERSAKDFYLSSDRDVEKEGARQCRTLTDATARG